MGEGITTFDCASATTREINTFLKAWDREAVEVALANPDSRHNLAVGLSRPTRLSIEGPVGYYCCGLCSEIDVRIHGDAGWGLAENLMSGRVELFGSAGSAAGATMRGGKVIVHGDTGARSAIAMKGGAMVVAGNVGHMSAFMMQKGVLVVCGDAGDGLGDSLYEGKIYIAGKAGELGSDAVVSPMTADDYELVSSLLGDASVDADASRFRKIVSGKRLYNFNTKEREIWMSAL